MASIDESAQHFQKFSKVVGKAIKTFGHDPKEDLYTMQKGQVEGLEKLENKYRKALIKDPNGAAAYKVFFDHILNVRRNILSARPYFRERRETFAEDVSKAIREGDVKTVQQYHFNFQFVNLIEKNLTFGKEVQEASKQLRHARQELITMNLPLVISRARIFWSRTHKSHLSFMDMVQIGVEGLCSAIDKFSGTYTEVYRAVIIGRISGNLISDYSATMLHFYPDDKRKLYRANKFKARHIHGDYEIDDLVKAVNINPDGEPYKGEFASTNPEEIQAIMAAAAIVAIDSLANIEGNDNDSPQPNTISKYAAPEEERPDKRLEHEQSCLVVQQAIKKLPLIEQKFLRLKGVEFFKF